MNDDFNKRLDSEMDVLMDSFTDIIVGAKIQAKDTLALDQEGYLIDCRATTIVRSCETLLAMISSIKQSLLLNDTRSINAITQAHREKAQGQIAATQKTYQHLATEVDQMLNELQSTLRVSRYVR
ncbi:hypothetical protein H4R33_002457 [Dimargaris cristalligena]|uniref:Mediator complex, subunit Med22 n=1 Tax=Dimargaris cristalligena TaxID=215637 RepID=A0A4P9ZVL2_9FUNG|nr:hypothetical protein H4R33_002457 [Dimargaris cristalligena]RKP37635.1 mediator complex, subunit Med22 [Dimargaris cristalligena]|eukprot:RKP37635.1 mediator complex, subunit Med22 [Dimargaris cristalligena]